MAGLRDSRMLSVMNSIKCAGCGKAIDIMALGDHVCEANVVTAPAAPTPKKKLYGDSTIPTSTSPFADDKPTKPLGGGFFNWRKPSPPTAIDTLEANNKYDSPPELSGSDYSDENRSTSPPTPSTLITSPGSTWSRGQPNKALGIYTQPTSPGIQDDTTDPVISEPTTRIGLWGGGLFKRSNYAATTNSPDTPTRDKALPTTPEKMLRSASTVVANNTSEPVPKPQFRNAAARNMLNMENRAPSPMKEVFSSRPPPPQTSDPARMFADIEGSNPFFVSTLREQESKMDMTSPIQPIAPPAHVIAQDAPESPRSKAWYGFDSAKTPSPLKSAFAPVEAVKSPRQRDNMIDESSVWNSPTPARTRAESKPMREQHVRKPSFKTIDPAIQRPEERPMPPMNKPMFIDPFSASPQPRKKMFPEATPIGVGSAVNARPGELQRGSTQRFKSLPMSRFAQNDLDMYPPIMSSSASSSNSSPDRYPFRSQSSGHARNISDMSSVPSSNASTASSSSSSQFSRNPSSSSQFSRNASTSSQFSRSVASRHICRGCTQPIFGRSLKDSSGRLTGRYHRECFRCSCCTAPFPSGEFYVLANEPLCKRDYHERNGSQCSKCRGGVEGRYVQTDDRKVFHDVCFGCVECDIPLGEEYWEVGGRPMCQRHAMVMARMQSNVRPALGILQGPGRKPSSQTGGMPSFESSAATYRSPLKRSTKYGMMNSYSRDRMGSDR